MKRRTFLKAGALVPTFVGLFKPMADTFDMQPYCNLEHTERFDLRKPVIQHHDNTMMEYATNGRVLVRRCASWFEPRVDPHRFPDCAGLFKWSEATPWRPFEPEFIRDREMGCHACECTGVTGAKYCCECQGEGMAVDPEEPYNLMACPHCRNGYVGPICPECNGTGETMKDREVILRGIRDAKIPVDSHWFHRLRIDLQDATYCVRDHNYKPRNGHGSAVFHVVHVRGRLGEGLIAPLNDRT